MNGISPNTPKPSQTQTPVRQPSPKTRVSTWNSPVGGYKLPFESPSTPNSPLPTPPQPPLTQESPNTPTHTPIRQLSTTSSILPLPQLAPNPQTSVSTFNSPIKNHKITFFSPSTPNSPLPTPPQPSLTQEPSTPVLRESPVFNLRKYPDLFRDDDFNLFSRPRKRYPSNNFSDTELNNEPTPPTKKRSASSPRSTDQIPSHGLPCESFASPIVTRNLYDAGNPSLVTQDTPHPSYPGFNHYKTSEGTTIVIRLDTPLSSGANKSVYEAYFLPSHTSVRTAAVALISKQPIKHLTSKTDSFGILGNYVDTSMNQHFQLVKRGLTLKDVCHLLKTDHRLATMPVEHHIAFILTTLPSTLSNLDDLAIARHPHQDIKCENLVYLPNESRTLVIDFDELELNISKPTMFTSQEASPKRGHRPAVDEAGIYNIAKILRDYLEDLHPVPVIASFIEQNLNANHSERQSYQAAHVTLSHCVATLQNEHPDRYDQNMATIKDVLTETLNNRLHN